MLLLNKIIYLIILFLPEMAGAPPKNPQPQAAQPPQYPPPQPQKPQPKLMTAQLQNTNQVPQSQPPQQPTPTTPFQTAFSTSPPKGMVYFFPSSFLYFFIY